MFGAGRFLKRHVRFSEPAPEPSQAPAIPALDLLPEEQLPGVIRNYVGMLTVDDRQIYFQTARDFYEFKGAIVDLGAFLGGTAACLVMGALHNMRAGFPNQVRVHSYDLFELDWAGRDTVKWWADRVPAWGRFGEVKTGTDTTAIHTAALDGLLGFIDVHKGDITAANYDGAPIEILSVDICKSRETTEAVFRIFMPKLLPGAYILQQDMVTSWHPYLVTAVGYFFDHFEVIHEPTEGPTVLYRLTKLITDDQMADFANVTLRDRSQWLSLWDRAVAQLKSSRVQRSLQASRICLIAETEGYEAAAEAAEIVIKGMDLAGDDAARVAEVLWFWRREMERAEAARSTL